MGKQSLKNQLLLKEFEGWLIRRGYVVVKELFFAKPRRFRFDYALPDAMIAIEIEGAVWTGGRHTRGSGFVKDMEKYNIATHLGWKLYRFSYACLLARKYKDFL